MMMRAFWLFAISALCFSVAAAQEVSHYHGLVQKGKTQLQAGTTDLALLRAKRPSR
jgi:hypothetical protein